MKSSRRDKTEGNLNEAKGKVKEIVGNAVGNSDLEAEGKNDQLAGKVQKKVGEIKKILGK
ncbi:MAG: CsbD family protein [Acidobacteriota bacterium]|nr:CsbD family protein [Acidobacteriota bacterium]